MKAKRIAGDICYICMLIILCISSFNLTKYFLEYKNGRDTYNKAKEIAEIKSPFQRSEKNFDALKKKNSDTVGWIKIKDTPIDYPIVHCSDNEKYLHTLFDGKQGGAGTLFVDCANDPFKSFNTIIYGHRMKDGTMFNSLKKYDDESWGKKHSTFKLYTEDGDYDVKVMAFCLTKAGSDIYNRNVITTADKGKYLDTIYTSAKYTLDRTANTNDKLVLLSTCTYEFENARYVLIGKLV